MIPVLALAIPLLRETGLRQGTRSRPKLVVPARLATSSGVRLKAALALPAEEPPTAASNPRRNRLRDTSAVHSDVRAVNEHLPRARDRTSSTEADPEVRRIERALRAIELDPRARQRFYTDVDALVRSVRSGQPIPQSLTLDQELAPPADRARASFGTAAGPSPPEHRVREQLVTAHSEQLTTPDSPPETAPAPSPDFGSQPPNIAGSQPRPLRLLSPNNNPLDPGVVSRITYWAQVNGCPIELALAVAWQESGMNLHPARGSSGEIGIMQIMPERARLEGVDPSSLYDPEMNLWLGTKLLARYYSEEGTVARAALKYVAGPGVFEKRYRPDVRDYISWYSASVDNYARYFGRHVNF